MSCYHPLIRIPVGCRRGKNGKLVDTCLYRSAFRKDDSGRLQTLVGVFKADDNRYHDVFDVEGYDSSSPQFFSGEMVRCGKCLGCRMDYSKEWANRCVLELQYHKSAYFVTITYDQDHVPVSYYSDPDTGEAQPVLTLCKSDFQAFIKRLRKRVEPQRIRYFAAGEYGEKTQRPHYHAIIFGLELNDLVSYERNAQGDMTYTSDFLHSVWSTRKAPTRHGSVTPLSADPDYFCEPWGRIVVAPVTWKTCAYTARYTVKKAYGFDAKVYETFNIEPPFVLMSKHPGIGFQYLEDHPEVKDFDKISVKSSDGGISFRPPHAFEQKFKESMPDFYEERRRNKVAIMQAARDAQMRQTSLTYGELLAVQERNLKNKVKKLRREL